ncbi:Enoyl-CoA hydratase/isomerase family [Musa troglodytarum]|uniref:Enoyl-CoA hydratase/isomerase family n=1 Tax=Musa troglodytarum TaxID=320322 RepID=A0A9E7HL70_9LILI|nr:Enoyl-CoA hydratase/isomerase family [Musa troglodytarum]
MKAAEPVELIVVERDPAGVAVVTINRPKALNSLTRPMIVSLAAAIRRLDADPAVGVVVITGRGRAFCSGVDFTAAEEVFKGDVKDIVADPVIQMERCRKPIIGAINGYAVTAGFEIALACDILIAGKDAKFVDTHTRFGIFPSWGLSQKLPRIIGINRAREVSLSGMAITAEMAEKWGLVNHVVDNGEVLKKAKEVAQAILRNNRNMVLRYKSVINDGSKLDLGHALALEKVIISGVITQMEIQWGSIGCTVPRPSPAFRRQPHDFDLIKNIVFPDGTIPRCQDHALPTRVCLFKNPLFDGESVIEIWNFSKFGGSLELSTAKKQEEQRVRGYLQCYRPVSCAVHVKDIEWDQKKEAMEMGEAEEFAVYLNQAGELLLIPQECDAIAVTVHISSFEFFSFVPIL